MRARLIMVTLIVGSAAFLSHAGAGPISRQTKPSGFRPGAGLLSGAGLRADAARRFISDAINGTKSNTVNNIGGGSEQPLSVEEFRTELLAPADDVKPTAVRNRLFPNIPTAEASLIPEDGATYLALRRFQQLNSGEFYSVNFIELRSAEIDLRNVAISIVLLDRIGELKTVSPGAQANLQNLILAIESAVSELASNAEESLERVEDPKERDHMQKTYLTMFETVLASSNSAAWSAALRTGHTNFETRLHALLSDKFQIARAKLSSPATASPGGPGFGNCSELFGAGSVLR